ncbi:hypothetical protein L3V83_11440 [Thiotrichales bacterium 19X7-9]|nr:hypothetical protein [Thiotrichales bacterium 19X7-9]
MNQLDITLLIIDQYIKQQETKKSISKYFTNEIEQAKLLSEILQDMIKSKSIASEFDFELIEDPNEFEIIEMPEVIDEFEQIQLNTSQHIDNLNHINDFINGFIQRNTKLMKQALKNCGIEKSIDFEAFIINSESLRVVIEYTLTLQQSTAPDKYNHQSSAFNEQLVKRKLPNFEDSVILEPTNKGGKQKYFQDGFVYARSEDIVEEFEKETALKEYVTAILDPTYQAFLLDRMSFQEQDPKYPLRARVSIYGFDNENYFGFETLDQFMQNTDRGYSPQQILEIIQQIFDIMFHFWVYGISHQDLHAGNIKIIPDDAYDDDQTYFKVKIFDFGNAEFSPQLPKQKLLIDWLYLLKSASLTYSDELGRAVMSYLPFENDISNKHYPIFKLLQIIDYQDTLKTIFEKHSDLFINSLIYADTSNPEAFKYLYDNFKYSLFYELEESIKQRCVSIDDVEEDILLINPAIEVIDNKQFSEVTSHKQLFYQFGNLDCNTTLVDISNK